MTRSADGPVQGRRIVVIAADAAIRELVHTVLGAAGYHIVSTDDPRKALELVRAEQPELVLCETSMPALDGYGVLKALQSDPDAALHPVVLITTSREVNERVSAFRHGVVDHLTKPFTPEALLAKVLRVMGSLPRRQGIVHEEVAPGRVPDFVRALKREARTGLLSATGPEGTERMVFRAGNVVDGPPEAPATTTVLHFQEMDPRDDIAPHDPNQLPQGEELPPLEDMPEGVRQVLIVDDNTLFRRFLSDVLRSRGFTVHEAVDGAEGLRMALDKRPWLILSDVRMPEMDGFDFCRAVRRHSIIRHTPFLFLSGWDRYKDRYEGLEIGANDFISKQTPVREVVIRVQLVMQRFASMQKRDRRGSGLQGKVSVVGAPALLQICHLSRLTGLLTVRDDDRRAVFGFRDGDIVTADGPGAAGPDAVFDLIRWTQGGYEFAAGDVLEGTPVDLDFDWLLLEGCRRLDESA